MQFRMSPAPFQRGKRTTLSIMLELSVVLCVVWLATIVFCFAKGEPVWAVHAILVGLIALVTSFVTDVVVALCLKKKGKEIIDYFKYSYSYVTALIFALIVPASIPYFALVFCVVFAIVIAKVFFGGFGYNIANPAAVARIVAGTAFGLGVVHIPDLIVSGVTITTAMNWQTGALPSMFTHMDLFLGNYVGSMGETMTFLLIIAGIYLAVRKIIDYRLALSFILTIFILAFVLAFVLKIDFPLSYALSHVFLGGAMFGAVFMVTDPVTTPTSQLGKIIFGIGAGAITVLIRVSGALPEGVVFSIVLMNLVTPLIDRGIIGQTSDKKAKKWGLIALVFVGAIAVNVAALWLGGVI